MLLKIIFETPMSRFYIRIIIRKILKSTFEILFFLIKEYHKQRAAFNYYQYGARTSGIINR